MPRKAEYARLTREQKDRLNEHKRKYRATAHGKATVAADNATRLRVGNTYLGKEHHFPAPREAVEQFARELIEQHRKELHGTNA